MAENPLTYAFPVTVEFVGILIVILGIAIELTTGGDIGYMCISIGSALIALGSLIWSKIMKIQSKERNSFKGGKH